jgi:hypothetical protein
MRGLSTSLVAIVPLVLLAPVAGCSSDPGSGGSTSSTSSTSSSSGSGGPSAGPTFHKDVEPILQKACQNCHSSGRIAPFNLTSYADAKAVADLMVLRTQDGSMPPWGAQETSECKPRHGWKDDRRLSAAEIATIAAWRDAGSPEGDVADAPPAGVPAVLTLAGVEQTVEPVKPFVSSGDTDQFRCFVIDPKLATPHYLNGSNFIAGNPKVVHHALMFLDAKGESVPMADADGGYDCFGGAGFSGAELIAAWAPGGVPNEYAPNIGMLLPAGAKLVMQIHYHPAGTTGAPDSTKFEMRFTKKTPDYLAVMALIGNFGGPEGNGDGLLPGPNDDGGPQFKIPAGAKQHTETMQFTLPEKVGGGPLPELFVYGVSTHMHYVGTDMLIDVSRASTSNGDPESECLLQTPKWDFNWQRGYDYDAEIEKLPRLHAGDKLGFRCTYDNSMDNPFVAKALFEQKLSAPEDVYLGETTLDEMCLGALNVIYKNGAP